MLFRSDGVGDINVAELITHHRAHGRLATITATQPPGRFGALRVEGNKVVEFAEKPTADGWVNGGFFVLSSRVLDYISGDDVPWEAQPMERLTADGQVSAYFHRGWWQSMDTLREKNILESLWASGRAPWKTWE